MLTIRAMVRVGPWTIETIDREEKGTHCERCSKAIKWIYVCRVDADAPQLAALPNSQQVWRIGSTCGPTLLMVSEEVWSGATKERFAAIQLIYRANRVLELAASYGDKDWALNLIEERAKKLCDGPLPRNLQFWLSSNVGRLERAYEQRSKADEQS